MKSRVAVPLLCLMIWMGVLACSDGMIPTDTREASFSAGGRSAFGFNGNASGFPTGAVRLTGGGSYDPATASNVIPTETSGSSPAAASTAPIRSPRAR